MPLQPIPAPLEPPPLRLPGLALPPYRYVPGLNPHPFRHPEGHLYTDGTPPAEPPWDPTAHWTRDTGWLRGLDLFDHRYWWEAHEAWEAVWHQVPRSAPYRDLLQGMIQAAAGLLRHHMGAQAAAERLLARGIARLERAVAAGPEQARGLDVPTAAGHWQARLAGGPWPPPLETQVLRP